MNQASPKKKSGFWTKVKTFFGKTKPFWEKIGAFFGKTKPFWDKIGAFLKKLEPAWNKIKAFMSKYMPTVCRVALCAAAVFFAVYAVLVITDTDAYIDGFFQRSAYISFDKDLENAEGLTQAHYNRLYNLRDQIRAAETKEEIKALLDLEYNNLLCTYQGKLFDRSGRLFGEDRSGYSEITALTATYAVGCSDAYYDEESKIEYIAFYVPVLNSDFMDGLVSYVETKDIIDLSSIRTKETDALVLMDKSGAIVAESTDQNFAYTTGGNIRQLLVAMTPDDKAVTMVAEAIQSQKRGSTAFVSNEEGYTITLSPIEGFGSELWLVNLTENQGLLSPELEYVRHIINICVVSILSLTVGIFYVILRYKKKYVADISKGGFDTPEGCPGKDVFRINAGKLLQNRERKFALAVLEVRQFRYISESLSEKDNSQLLAYIAKVIQALCNARETYGYLGEGKFGLLIHIENDHTVKDRVRLVESIASKNALLGAGKSKRKFNIGISITQESMRPSFAELLGYAEIACEKAKSNINVPYIIFNEQINSERRHNEKIEAEMEAALANGEFRLFLQPKYNVEADRIDSAEALVRWFDTKTGDYRFPGEFIGLFESNGFITKLDHFMYLETLKYLSTAAERFDKIVPISVNVSMVTVSDPGFLDFYVESKKKYRIGDNFIIIEFTESFAMEDYQKIRAIVDTLHENGIRCSLDDFGSGYSSLGTLKNIPFDELKFDRLFLDRGYNKQNDDAMLETMFALAKSMNIRVVQEGVETKEMFEQVIAKGCDVIQGYYYAKAIPVEEYRLFINSNTSIKYKSRVK